MAEVSPEAEPAQAVYFGAPDAGLAPKPPVEVVSGFMPTHWGTQVMDVRDPDGRVFHVEAPA